jgi:hypothetical protein
MTVSVSGLLKAVEDENEALSEWPTVQKIAAGMPYLRYVGPRWLVLR